MVLKNQGSSSWFSSRSPKRGCSKGSVSLWGPRDWGCVRSDVAFTFATVRKPSATVRNRPQAFAWGPYGRAYGKFCRRGHFWMFQTSRCFVSRGRLGISWHSDVFPESVWAQGSSNSRGSVSHLLIFHSFSSSHLLIFTSSHLHIIFTSSHLLIFTSSHLLIFWSSHLFIFTPSHLHNFTSSHLHIFTSSHPHIFTSAHIHILTSSHLLIFTSAHLHTFSSSHLF